ncbi:ribosomal protein S7 domain-containing protein [Collybia nuda]|uniref:Ribosomal protein S7 domain-containing protein n=1 Tax=Collybia nuda TaxID=64659 RepID=A0A9P5Y4U4_9AGAR|nr:ribosomal protein S7 domain-containing protein [Collybia nuda]
MISSLRSKVVRCFPHNNRSLSSAISTSNQNVMKEAYSALGVNIPAPITSTPKPVATSSSAPTIMDIPPAEDPLLHYITSRLMQHGNRAKASRIMSRTLLHIHAFTRAPPLPIVRKAVFDAAPAVRTLMHRQGGKTVPKPIALGEKQRTRFAVQAILKSIEKKSGALEWKLARELISIVQGTSEVLKKKEEIHRFAMVNRGNAQTRI